MIRLLPDVPSRYHKLHVLHTGSPYKATHLYSFYNPSLQPDTKAEFLDVIQTKVLRDFLLVIHKP
jgi:hypothetical protein